MLASFALILVAVLLSRRTLPPGPAAATATAVVFLGLLLWIVYYFIDALTGAGIDSSVLYQLRTDWEGVGISDFAPLASVTALMLILAIVLSVFIYRVIRSEPPAFGSAIRIAAACVAIAGSFFFNPALHDIVALGQIVRSTEASISGDLPELFVPAKEVSFAGRPRNFIILYLESVERTYLDPSLFPGLMPNLSALEGQALSFTDITQVDGTNWTISGMVASQCGMPLVNAGANNSMSGLDTFLPGATCLGDLLASQGYALSYIGGADLDFAGKGNFYRTHGFGTVEGVDELRDRLEDPEYLSDWGLYDDTLYGLAVGQFDGLSRQPANFGQIMLTVDTHHPYGYMSRDCGDMVYGDGKNEILNAVHCADLMAGKFIRHVTGSPAFADTVLVVVSDHLAMPNSARDILERGERRNLVLFFGKDIAPALNDKPGSMLDLAPTLLNLIGADVEGFGYGRDLLAETPTLIDRDGPLDVLLHEDAGFLASLWSFPRIENGISVDLASEKAIVGGRNVKLPTLFQLDRDLATTDVQFDFYEDRTLAEIVADLPYDQRFIWIDHCERTALLMSGAPSDGAGFCLVAGMPGGEALEAKDLADGTTVGFAELQEIFASAQPSRERYEERHSDFARLVEFGTVDVISFAPPPTLVGDFALKSSGFSQGPSFATNRALGEKVGLLRGLTLLGFDADRPPVRLAHRDTCGYGGVVSDTVGLEGDFGSVIAKNRGEYGAFAIVAHDSVLCYGVETDLEPLFRGTGLSRWQELGFEQPYVALLPGGGDPVEFVGAPRTALAIEARDFVVQLSAGENREPVAQRQLDGLPRVAHAGGAIEGAIYTDALEALDANAEHYDLFEIDLSWTSDGQLVCLHDWEDAFKATFGYVPSERPDLEAFENLVRDHAGFTNCTLETLAAWMQRNPEKRIVLDVKEDVTDALRLIAERFPDLRPAFIPQIYQPEEYATVRSLGYDDIIWTLYRYEGSDEDVLAAIRATDLFGLAMPVERAQDGLARRAREETGVLSLAHTINSVEDFRTLQDAGIAEIFTDYLHAR